MPEESFENILETRWGDFVRRGFCAPGELLPRDIIVLGNQEAHEFLRLIDSSGGIRCGEKDVAVWEEMMETKFLFGAPSPNRRAWNSQARRTVDAMISAYVPSREDMLAAALKSPTSWIPHNAVMEGFPHPLSRFISWIQYILKAALKAELVGWPPGVKRLAKIIRAGGIPIGMDGDPLKEWPDGTIVVCWPHDEDPVFEG